MKSETSIINLAIMACMLMTPAAYAEPLAYSGNNQNALTGQVNNAQQAQSKVVPVSYSTNYETQYAPYSSFMQSPYSQGNAMLQYNAGAPMNAPAAGSPQNSQGNDPLQASEVSPYSRYSPYIEIVGEGSNYTLGIDDVITIIVRNQPDFSGRFVVDPEGNVQYNFVGDVAAVGKTKDELKKELTERLKKFIRYPEVAVMISEYRSKAVYVFGYVNNPGKYAMKGDNITLKEALVAAGLPRFDGATNRVYVIRPSEYTGTGKPEKLKVNVNKLLNQGESSADFILQPGDTVVVNQRYFDKFINNFSRIIGPMFQAAAVYDLGFGTPDNGFFGGKDKD